MGKTGRNDPCPCGSGKKYKQCCLNNDEARQSRLSEEFGFVETALGWLTSAHEKEVDEAIKDDFFAALNDEEIDEIPYLSSAFTQMLTENIRDWLLSDAILKIDGKDERAIDLILGPDGPDLPQKGSEYLRGKALPHLSLFEVLKGEPHKGVIITDMLNEKTTPIFVKDLKASQGLVPWSTLGARLVERNGEYHFSGGVYPMPREEALACLDILRQRIENAENADAERAARSREIIGSWLKSLVAPPEDFELDDQGYKGSSDVITDIYEVNDWETLLAALRAREDIEEEEEGITWARITSRDDGAEFHVATIERTSYASDIDDVLEVLCDTHEDADDTRQWLEGFAGELLSYADRDVFTPSKHYEEPLRKEKRKNKNKKKKKRSSAGNVSTLSAEDRAQILFEITARFYEKWSSMRLPDLNDKTPLEAAEDPELRPMLVELLKRAEQNEALLAEEHGRAVFDLSYLWEQLKVERPGLA